MSQPNDKVITIETLLNYLAMYGGTIISSNDLQPDWIEQARASDRMYVDENHLGYIWEPPIQGFPETENEVEQFEKWYPLEVKLPPELDSPDFLFKKRINILPLPLCSGG